MALWSILRVLWVLYRSTPCCCMSSWHDDITGYHEEGTDGMHVGKNDLNDVYIVTLTGHHWSDCSRNLRNFAVAVHWQYGQYHCCGNSCRFHECVSWRKQMRSHSCSESSTGADRGKDSWELSCNETSVCDISTSSFQLVCSSWLCDRFSPSLWGGALADIWVRQQSMWMMWTEPMEDQRQCGSYCVRRRVVSKVRGLSLRATSHGYASRSTLVVTMNTWTMPSHSTVKDAMSTETGDSCHLVLLLRCTVRPFMVSVMRCENMSVFTAEKWLWYVWNGSHPQMMDGSEGECEESCYIILFDTSLTCCIALCTFVQYGVCSQSSFLSTDHMRKHDDITHASAWLKSHWKGALVVHVCVRHY